MNNKDVLSRIEKLETRVFGLEQILGARASKGAASSSSAKKLSLSEFLNAKAPTDDVKKVLTVGYFLEKHLGITSFNANDLEHALERAKAKKPKNINDKVNMNIKNGHMDEASEKKDNHKAWYLTNLGEAYIDNNFAKKHNAKEN